MKNKKSRSFSHLTQVDRLQIAEGLSRGFTHLQIAKMLGRDRSTISREIRRNRDENGEYRCRHAHLKSRQRRTNASLKPRRITQEHIENIYQRLCKGQSPDIIAHRSALKLKVSTTWIYELIDRQIKTGDEDFDKTLLYRKYRHRRGVKRIAAGKALIPNRRDSSERPKYVDKRRYFGDWEADLIIGKTMKAPW